MIAVEIESKEKRKKEKKKRKEEMMNLKKLSNFDLDRQLKSLVVKEREILKDVLNHITEVDRRKLYLSMGFDSLFTYLTKHIGYGNGCAQRRIDAARLSFDVPEVILQLNAGRLNLSQTTLVQKAIRHLQSTTNTKVPLVTKRELINDLCDKSVAESEIMIARAFGVAPLESSKVKHQCDESVRLEVTLTKVQWEKLQKAREILSHVVPDGRWNQVLEYLADKAIKQKSRGNIPDKDMRSDKDECELTANESVNPIIGTGANKANNGPNNEMTGKNKRNTEKKVMTSRISIPIAVQRKLFLQNSCCQYQEAVTGRRCDSRWQLSIDHIQPIWAGGTNELSNLRILCANHNREIYRRQSGIRKM